MSRTAALLAMVVLVTGACDRNKTPDLVRGAGAPVPGAAAPPPMEPAPASGPPPALAPGKATAGKSTVARSSANPAALGASSGAGRPTRKPVSEDPCSGLDGAELDDCLGFDAGDSRDERGERDGRDFAAEQRQRDRALMEREADEHAAAADQPTFDATEEPIDPQDELPPEDYDPGIDDGYDPSDEPPPDDDPER